MSADELDRAQELRDIGWMRYQEKADSMRVAAFGRIDFIAILDAEIDR